MSNKRLDMDAIERLKAIKGGAERSIAEIERNPYRSGQLTDAEKIVGLCSCLEAVAGKCDEALGDGEWSIVAARLAGDIKSIINRELGVEPAQ